uniref:Uncharacterized protein n=1 Tax=Oryza punctata TaxID=4537 RepID=A0A0E0LJ57_ORYPU
MVFLSYKIGSQFLSSKLKPWTIPIPRGIPPRTPLHQRSDGTSVSQPCPPSTLTAAPSGSLTSPLILRFLPSIKPPPGLLNPASRQSCLQTRPLSLLMARPLATLCAGNPCGNLCIATCPIFWSPPLGIID